MDSTKQRRSVAEIVLRYFEPKGDMKDLSEQEKLGCKYLDNRLVDSFGIIEMVGTFEKQFGINFKPEHLESDEFSTVGGLVNLIEAMLQAQSVSLEKDGSVE